MDTIDNSNRRQRSPGRTIANRRPDTIRRNPKPRQDIPKAPGLHGERGSTKSHLPLTPKQEAFARIYVQTGDASLAYRESHNIRPTTTTATINSNAYRLVHYHEGVGLRIRELRAKVTNVTVESITVDLEEDRQLARRLGQAGAAVSATKAKAQVAGIIDKGASSVAEILAELGNLVRAVDGREAGRAPPSARARVIDAESDS